MSNRAPEIIDLCDKGPDCREWQELERYIRETIHQIVREIVASDREPVGQGTEREPLAQGTGNGNQKTQRERERERELIRQGLERYRTGPPDSNIRKGIDWLLQRHASWERFMQRDSLFRIRHNALVLEYIISHPMTHVAIEKRLGISDNGYKHQLEKGIDELAQILFGYRE